ncbi:MAG: hypothetical protein Q8W45_04175 [Candidatus Palauibacterales bacterium]|nr:hypothetical protein [Candidatus Palauibacterales bacterium]MDP2482460.1 hypothetical protein [Candidatus Palauibacterales bacterium]
MGQNSGKERFSASAAAEHRAEADPVLLAKYLDYCSARISEVFLSLTDERTYQIMEEAAREAGLTAGALSFQSMMQLVTRKLQVSVPLPDFETWTTEYGEHPERYDPYLLGLWESEGTDQDLEEDHDR